MATNPEQKDVVRSGGLTVSANTGEIVELFEIAPHKTFFHVRDTLGAIFGSHRREWLKATDVNFQRGGMRAAAFGRRETGSGFRSDKQFYYVVDPKRKSVPRTSTPDLNDITGTAFTRSEAALGLETGGTFRAKGGRFMAIPIGHALNKNQRPKPGFSSPEALAKSPRLVNTETIVFADNGGAPIIYLIDRLGGIRKDTGERRIKRKVRLLPVFVLVRSVTRKPRMRFMETWDKLSADRDRRFRLALTKIVDELKRPRR